MTPPPASPTPQLTDEHLRQLRSAATTLRRIKRTGSVAKFDGWTVGIFGALTWLMGMTDPVNITLGVVMGAIAAVELTAAERLMRFDVRAARMLAINQLVLAALLIGYAGWRIYAVITKGAVAALLGTTGVGMLGLDGSQEQLLKQCSLILYGGVIAIAVLGQGGMAIYYALRGRAVAAYVRDTPQWIQEMQRAGFGV